MVGFPNMLACSFSHNHFFPQYGITLLLSYIHTIRRASNGFPSIDGSFIAQCCLFKCYVHVLKTMKNCAFNQNCEIFRSLILYAIVKIQTLNQTYNITLSVSPVLNFFSPECTNLHYIAIFGSLYTKTWYKM